MYGRQDGKLYVTAADGTTAAEELKSIPLDYPTGWSRDGDHIIGFQVAGKNGSNDIGYYRRSPGGGRWEGVPYLAGPFDEGFAAFSPDGHFVVYVSNESGDYEVYVKPFPEGPGKWRISTNGGVQPRWSRMGKEITYLQRGLLMTVPVAAAGGELKAGAPQSLFETGAYAAERVERKYDELPDGRFVLIERAAEAAEKARVVHVISNWPALLEGRQ